MNDEEKKQLSWSNRNLRQEVERLRRLLGELNEELGRSKAGREAQEWEIIDLRAQLEHLRGKRRPLVDPDDGDAY